MSEWRLNVQIKIDDSKLTQLRKRGMLVKSAVSRLSKVRTTTGIHGLTAITTFARIAMKAANKQSGYVSKVHQMNQRYTLTVQDTEHLTKKLKELSNE